MRSRVEAFLKWLLGIIVVIIAGILSIILYDARGTIGNDLHQLSVATVALVLYVPLLISVGVACVVELKYRDGVRGDLTELERMRRQSGLDNQLLGLDDTLLRLMLDLLSAPDLHAAAKNAVRAILQRITSGLFPDRVFRAYVLRPDSARENLVPWVGYLMGEETMRRASFRIKGSDNFSGEAGYSFVHRVIRIGHKQDDGTIDAPHYIEFERGRPIIPYKCFLCVPLNDIDDKCVGVMCLDSAVDSAAFDAEDVRELLLSIGQHIAALIRVYEHLKDG